jgi:putative flippase GtrA
MIEPSELSNDTRMGKPIRQLLRYGVVGVVTNLALYFFYLLITYLGIEPKKAMTVSYIVGALIGFVGHRQWTFTHKGALLGSGARYFIAHLFGYLINFLILLTFVDRLGYSHQWVQAAAIIVVAGFLFVTFKYFVFPKDNISDRNNK